jgi:hypothetical protein
MKDIPRRSFPGVSSSSKSHDARLERVGCSEFSADRANCTLRRPGGVVVPVAFDVCGLGYSEGPSRLLMFPSDARRNIDLFAVGLELIGMDMSMMMTSVEMMQGLLLIRYVIYRGTE